MNYLAEVGKQMLAAMAVQADTIHEQANKIVKLEADVTLYQNWHRWHDELKARYDELEIRYNELLAETEKWIAEQKENTVKAPNDELLEKAEKFIAMHKELQEEDPF